ncbi:MAG: PIN domain-containing protein [Actinomycetota bacterium]|jgi:predicted nucleic acid-binding protein|nr:PIN domain-containing protein [Actinomycetota bacterium]MDQ3567256.1 PIN domain-containing protein [Actinomycetota bacterium]
MRDRENDATRRFMEISESGQLFGITGVIFQEVLQGAASQAKFDYLTEYLGSQTFYHPQGPIESYKEAALIYFRCRRAGVTIRSAVDCLIARVAIEHDLVLLHDDRDFEKMAGVIPELTLA